MEHPDRGRGSGPGIEQDLGRDLAVGVLPHRDIWGRTVAEVDRDIADQLRRAVILGERKCRQPALTGKLLAPFCAGALE